MVCTANDLQEWKDFPKGLRVLLLDEDHRSAAEIRSKLEAMDYHVTTFCNETEALLEFSSSPESFHVAIIEVNTSNGDWGFEFLQNAKDLPIIMTSNIHCLSTMMKGIALGAVEFLPKPLSEDKLKNIWQHVVHKAFNAGGNVITESFNPVNKSLVSMVQPKLEKEPTCNISVETENVSRIDESDHEPRGDKYPAPSTPQIKRGSRLLDDGDCQDQMNCLSEKESGENDSESKSVETTCPNPFDGTGKISEPLIPWKTVVKEEEELADRSKSDNNMAGHLDSRSSDIGVAAESLSKASNLNNSCKSSRKKMKVDWTPELHKKFVQAVEQLGVDQAIPSRILELMKTEGLTRHNVASHLQKYRLHNRHILPKEDDRRLPHPRDSVQSYYPQKPIMAFPTYQYATSLSMPPVYPMWGQPGSHPASVPMWGQPGYPPWQTSESWHWNPYPGVQADAWGCPVIPPPQGGYPSYLQNPSGFPNAGVVDHGHSMPHNFFDLHPLQAEEVVDKVVKEAISKPWLPLPLGLKPPSTEGVLAELSRQGICNIPPQTNGSKNRSRGPGPMIQSQITSLDGTEPIKSTMH